jgi:hypothetical protein
VLKDTGPCVVPRMSHVRHEARGRRHGAYSIAHLSGKRCGGTQEATHVWHSNRQHATGHTCVAQPPANTHAMCSHATAKTHLMCSHKKGVAPTAYASSHALFSADGLVEGGGRRREEAAKRSGSSGGGAQEGEAAGRGGTEGGHKERHAPPALVSLCS